MSLNSFLQRITHQQVNDVEVITAERRIQAGDTVAAQAVQSLTLSDGYDRWGDPKRTTYVIRFMAVGYVTGIDLEGVATVRFYNEYRQRWQTGQWHTDDLVFVYNNEAIA